MKWNLEKHLFIGMAFLSLLALITLTFFINKETNILLSSSILFMIAIEVFQLIRIFKRGIVYKNWMNNEITYSTFIFILFLSVPNLLRFSMSTKSLKYFAIISLACMMIVLSGLIIHIIIYRNSFYNTDGIIIPEIIDVLEKRNISYNIIEDDRSFDFRSFDFFSKQKGKEIYLPKYMCRILKIGERIIVKPDNRKNIENVYHIINVLEGQTSIPNRKTD